LAFVACAGVKQKPVTGTGGSGSGNGGSVGTGGTGAGNNPGTGGTVVTTGCVGQCTDFEPTASNPNPLFDVGVSQDVGGLFGNPSGSGPCVTEPEDGALYPNNWAPVRVRVPGNSKNLKVTVHADMESTDLVAYSAPGETWTMPKTLWNQLAGHIVEQDITVTVQTPGGGATSVKFQIAAVGAGGSMVFWSADPTQANKQGIEATNVTQASLVNDSYLSGFTVGDTSTTKALTIDQVQQDVLTNDQHNARNSRCIGCHVGTPDGSYVSYVDAWPWPAVIANVSSDTTMHGKALPNYLGCSAPVGMNCSPPTLIQYAWGGPMAFSKTHWTDVTGATGERIGIMTSQMQDWTQPWATDDTYAGKLIWIDFNSTANMMANSGVMIPVSGTAYGQLPTGDKNAQGFPSWSEDGNTVVYVSAACPQPGTANNSNMVNVGCGTQDGRLATGPADIYQVPYNNKAGGTATPVPGASSKTLDEYYPALSPDGSFLAFTAIPSPGVMYANKQAELYVVPFSSQAGGGAGATAMKLVANTPPACSGMSSPGINNHWPRWSPLVKSSGQKTYYWIIFSSNRYGTAPQTSANGSLVQVSQLYITAVTVAAGDGQLHTVTSYPAIYLYNQDHTRLNTTPAWQDFDIPIVIDKP
jgi:Tol biopolymer transport system component